MTDFAKEMNRVRRLSNRECEVISLLETGLTNKQIAEKLFVTEKTIKFHLTSSYKKLGLKSRAQVIVAARNFENENRKNNPVLPTPTSATRIPYDPSNDVQI